MHKYTLTIEVKEPFTPGNKEHICALVNNPNNRNNIEFEHYETDQ